jgi:hypothetical protein
MLVAVCADPANPTVDEAELCRAVFGNNSPELCAWVDRVLRAEDARWPASTGVAYMSDAPYGFAGVETTAGIVVGSITEHRVEGVSRPDAMAAMRAFAEGHSVLAVNDAVPVALLAGMSPAEAEEPEEVPAADLPDPAAKILVEVSPQDETAVLDLWAMKRAGESITVWRRHDGKWESDPAFLALVSSGPMPKFLLMEPGDPVLAAVLPQVDAATSGKPFEPTVAPVAASGYGVYDPRDINLLVLVARGNRGGLKKAAGVGKGGNAETLRRYWAYGEGAAKIRWGVGGDWYRCRKLLSKYMGVRAKGYCQNLHIRVLGYSTATHAKMVRGGRG